MFRFVGRFHNIKIDRRRWTKAMNKEMEQLFREAMREFLIAVITKVPVYTGMSRGTLRPLGEFANNYTIPIEPNPRAPKYPGRDADAGEALSNFEWKFEGRHNYVRFDPGLFYYALNDFYNMKIAMPNIGPTPWESFQVGREAFKEYIREHLKSRMPSVQHYITRTEASTDLKDPNDDANDVSE